MELDKELQNKFHLVAGSYISGKIFTEYLFVFKEALNHKKKGETTLINRVVEAEAKAIKVINILHRELLAIGVQLDITEAEISGIEDILYDILKLDGDKQKRVMGLIKKLQKEEHESAEA